jgi:hypothetical protein
MHEAEIETTPEGQVPVGGGWFVLNLGEMAWETVPGFGVWRGFDAPDADPAAPGIAYTSTYSGPASRTATTTPRPRRKASSS